MVWETGSTEWGNEMVVQIRKDMNDSCQSARSTAYCQGTQNKRLHAVEEQLRSIETRATEHICE